MGYNYSDEDNIGWVAAHLTQTRFLPGPSVREVMVELVGLKERLCGERNAYTQISYNSLSAAAYTIGDELRQSKFNRRVNDSHLSLSNSSCIEYTRREGGKYAILTNEFKEFIMSPVSKMLKLDTTGIPEVDKLKDLLDRMDRKEKELVASDLQAKTYCQFIHANGISMIGSPSLEMFARGFEGATLPIRWPASRGPWDMRAMKLPYLETFPECKNFISANVEPIFMYDYTKLRISEKVKELEEERGNYIDAMGNKVSSEANANYPIWRIAYLAVPIEGSFMESYNIVDDNENVLFQLKKGIDSRLGSLLFLWAGYKYQEWRSMGSPPLPVDPVPISEPGVKSRIATKSRVWLNLFLSPAGHALRDAMNNLPGARVGLQGSNHAWEFEASFGRHADKWKSIEAISTSDLTAATDYLEHDLAATALKSFVDGLHPDDHGRDAISYKAYLTAAIELHCSPRLLLEVPSSFRRGKTTRYSKTLKAYKKVCPLTELVTVEHDNVEYSGYVTKRGVLMGEPIAKMVLSMLSLSAERSARANDRVPTTDLREFAVSSRKRHLYACAADDHIGIGQVSYLKAIASRLETWSGVVNWEKYAISNRMAHYCQDYIMKPKPSHKYDVRISGPRYKIDHVPLRLLSDRRKTGPSSFEEPNPFPGKIKDLGERLSWIGKGTSFNLGVVYLAKLGLGRWFGRDIIKDSTSYISQAYGGRGLPYIPGIEIRWPEEMRFALANWDDPVIQRLASGVKSSRVRGILIDPFENDKSKATALGLEILDMEQTLEEQRDERFGSQSMTSSYRNIKERYVPIDRVHDIDQKVQSCVRAFEGQSAFGQSTFVTYQARVRRVRANYRTYWLEMGRQITDPVELRKNLRQFPQRYNKYVRREDLGKVLPSPLVPSYTITTETLGGTAGLAEFPGNVITLPLPRTQVPDRIESASAASTVED